MQQVDGEMLPICGQHIPTGDTINRSSTNGSFINYYNVSNQFTREENTSKLDFGNGDAAADHDWFEIVIAIVCVLGIVGNTLNLVTLTRRTMLATMDRLERSATYGLVALALSDVLFCLTVCPHSFITTRQITAEPRYAYALYYRIYGIALINLFLMISTWLVVTISVQRFLVVVYPLQARNLLSGYKTSVSILLVYLLSAVCTIPHFMHLGLTRCRHLDGHMMLEITALWQPEVTWKLRVYMRWIWPIMADFVPLILLALCNSALVRELRTAARQRRLSCNGHNVKGVNHRVTLTLVVIVVMFFILVCPAEILKYVDPFRSWGETGYVVASVANVLQTVNFACNFVLYCAVNRHFRQTVKSLVMCCVPRPRVWGRAYTSQYSASERAGMIRLDSRPPGIIRLDSESTIL